jgi:hypothetical protein
VQPAILPITIPQGTDQTFSFTIAGYDLTTYTAKLQARTQYGAPTAFVTLTKDSGITLGNGSFSWTFTNAQTNTFPLGRWVYDFEITSGGGQVTRLIQGTMTVTPQVTQ